MTKQIFLLTLCALSGLAAGVINGFLGTGGGIIIIFELGLIFPQSDIKTRFVTAIAVILPMSAVSAIMYKTGGSLTSDGLLFYLIPAAIGGYVGARLLDKLNPNALKKVFAAILAIGGAVMIFK